MKKRYLYGAVAAVGFLGGLFASGCLQSTVTCTANLKACGQSCSDVSSDKANCGACGIACGEGQVCSAGACVCESGTSSCSGSCVVLSSDPQNCGACGKPCAQGQVCEGGSCKASCTLGGTTTCAGGCVDTTTDPLNCGSCGNACAQGQSCHAGSCSFDALATCIAYTQNGTIGQVIGFNASGERSQLTDVGIEPQTLSLAAPVVLVGDGNSGQLAQIRASDLSLLPPTNTIGVDPEGILSQPGFVYVTSTDSSSSAQSLTIFTADAGTDPATTGIALSALSGYAFTAGSNPHAGARVGNTVFVPQYGCCTGFGTCADPSLGNFVATIDVTNPAAPVDAGVIDLSTLSLQSFDGGTTYARPSTALAVGSKVYFPLSNLDPSCAVAGPGIVAIYDSADAGLSQVTLPTSECLEPFGITQVNGQVVVSCSGFSSYGPPPDYAFLGTQGSGLVMLQNDQPGPSYKTQCPAGVATCQDPAFGKLAARGDTLFVADQAQGRIFVLGASDAGFVERRGYATDAGPMFACLNDDGGSNFENVQDLIPVP
jgi:hypothetical protein